MHIALTREVPRTIVDCELTHRPRQAIDLDRARAQHDEYRRLLTRAGSTVIHLPEDPGHPDSVFVEDTAVVFGDCALMTRPGAASRRGELGEVEAILGRHLELLHLEAPARLDGGDVLVVGRSVFVGASTRSDATAVAQMEALLQPRGFRVRSVPLKGCLHLKSAVSAVSPETLLLNPDWVDPESFPDHERLTVDPAEPDAANVLLLPDRRVVAEAFPRTRRRLEEAGHPCEVLPADELAKAEAALTCCSVLFSVN